MLAQSQSTLHSGWSFGAVGAGFKANAWLFNA